MLPYPPGGIRKTPVFIGLFLLAPALLGGFDELRAMIDALFNQTNYLAAKSMLDASVLRQQAIAANIANVETPGYKRLEVAKSFEAEFEQAMAAEDFDRIEGLRPTLAVDTTAVPNKRDGNTVRIEDELLAQNKNFIEHTLETQMVTGSLMKLRLAITGRS